MGRNLAMVPRFRRNRHGFGRIWLRRAQIAVCFVPVRARSSVDRALASGARGQRFESSRAYHEIQRHGETRCSAPGFFIADVLERRAGETGTNGSAQPGV